MTADDGLAVAASAGPLQRRAPDAGGTTGGPAPVAPVAPVAEVVTVAEVAALRRELSRLRQEVADLGRRVQHLDGELGYAMLTSGRLRGRLDREVEARERLEARLAARDDDHVVTLPDQDSPSSRSAAARSGTRSFLTDVET